MTQTEMTIPALIEKIREEASRHDASERFYRVHAVGDEIRQGDVYLFPVEGVDTSDMKPINDPKLAPGNTKGARHIMSGDYALYDTGSSDPLAGPLLVVRSRSVLTHPEHGNISLATGQYRVGFQIDRRAEERRRAAD